MRFVFERIKSRILGTGDVISIYKTANSVRGINFKMHPRNDISLQRMRQKLQKNFFPGFKGKGRINGWHLEKIGRREFLLIVNRKLKQKFLFSTREIH